MADQKVSDLPSLNGVDVDPADLLYIVDSSAGTAGSKKITIGQFQLSPWSAGTVNGVVYFDGSKVPASSSALTFDGSSLNVAGGSIAGTKFNISSEGSGSAYLTTGYVRFVNAGGETARIDASGNLGIGTSSPSGRLDAAIVGTARLIVGSSGTSENYYDANTQIWRNGAGSTEFMRLNSSGNLGIGTSSPAEQVTAGNANDRVGLYQSGAITQLRLGSPIAGTAMMVLQYNRSTGSYQLSEGTNGNTGSPDIGIDASGSVGIGTASPGEKLDVVGAIRSTTASGVAAQLKVRQAGWGEYFIQVPTSENALAFVDNGTGTPVERARFNSLGNFGLGNVPLGTARLTVYGPTNEVQIRTDDGNVTAYVGYSSGTGASAVNIYGTATDHDQVFITKNVEVVRMKKTGQMRFQPLAAAPTPAEAGDVYYDSGTNKLRCYNGTTWNDLF